VAFCNDCKRFVNQYCDRCGENFGISVCEKYACGGTMRCPFCQGDHLSKQKEFGADPYNYRKKIREQSPNGNPCQKCGFELKSEWRFCPMCGKGRQANPGKE